MEFLGSYNAVLGRPYYAKFMVVPNYTHLKLKMPGPRKTIMISALFRVAYTCKQANCELASTLAGLQGPRDQGSEGDTPIGITNVVKRARSEG